VIDTPKTHKVPCQRLSSRLKMKNRERVLAGEDVVIPKENGEVTPIRTDRRLSSGSGGESRFSTMAYEPISV
jgi:hypothetical protein